MSKQIKVGVLVGAGPAPGYLWGVWFLTVASDDASGFLDSDQYAHMADQIKSLATEKDPTHPATVEVEQVESFYELKDKGGPILREINARVYFIVDKSEQQIVVLGAYWKKTDGKIPLAVKMRIIRRMRDYQNGELERPNE